MSVSPAELAESVTRQALTEGAEAADVLVVEGTDFHVTVRQGDIENFTDAGSKGLGLRVFVGRRTATAHTSDFSGAALAELCRTAVEMARATSEDPVAGLPDATPLPDPIDLSLHDPSVAALATPQRIEWARRA
jgi:PmbA protein